MCVSVSSGKKKHNFPFLEYACFLNIIDCTQTRSYVHTHNTQKKPKKKIVVNFVCCLLFFKLHAHGVVCFICVCVCVLIYMYVCFGYTDTHTKTRRRQKT